MQLVQWNRDDYEIAAIKLCKYGFDVLGAVTLPLTR